MEALWVHQYHNVVDVDLLKRVLGSPDFHARAAATRVLCYWRDRVPEALDLLQEAGRRPDPRVRLEAVRAASFFTGARGGRGRPDLRRPADRRVPRLRPRRDDEGARAVLAEGDPRGQAHRLHQRRRGALLPQERQHRRPAQDEAQPGRLPGTAVPQGRARRVPPRGADRPGEARQARAELQVLVDAIRNQDEQQDEPGRERRLRSGPSADRPRRRGAGRRPADLERLATGGQAAGDAPARLRRPDRGRRQRRQGLGAGLEVGRLRSRTWSTPCR